MGGSVGLKGTDGEMREKALELGAEPVSPGRVREFLACARSIDSIHWLVAPGAMGEDFVRGLDYAVVGDCEPPTTSDDTASVAREMLQRGVELIVFAGGDGTARDMMDAVGTQVPVVAIPSGVKVYSSVFAYSARAAAELLDAYMIDASVGEEEVLDIDEAAFRDGRVDSTHYGFLLVPEVERLLQDGKESSDLTGSAEVARQEMASAVVEEMQSGVLYLLGSGTTLKNIADELGVAKTLLGIDAVVDGTLVGEDLNERGILELLSQYRDSRIVVTPLGGNGFLFGRGNKQFTPEVLTRVGAGNIIVVATREKLLKLDALHVDTGDVAVDQALCGYTRVIVGSGRYKLMAVR